MHDLINENTLKKKNKKKVKLPTFPSILFPFPKDNSAKQCSVHLVFSFMAWYKALSYLFGIYQSQSIYCCPVTKNEALSSPSSSSLTKPPLTVRSSSQYYYLSIPNVENIYILI